MGKMTTLMMLRNNGRNNGPQYNRVRGFEQEYPEMRRDYPEMRREYPEMRRGYPEMQREYPEMRRDYPRMGGYRETHEPQMGRWDEYDDPNMRTRYDEPRNGGWYDEPRMGGHHSGGRKEVRAEGRMQLIRGGGYDGRKMDERMAHEWTEQMRNADGSTGPHWTMEQVRRVMEQHKIDCDPYEFYAVINAIYSDYAEVAKKHNANNIEFYADMAKAWIEDKDAVPHKAAAYYECVVRK